MPLDSETMVQPFSKQSGGQQRKTIVKFVETFEASGHDLGSLVVYFLEHTAIGRKHNTDARNSIREVLRGSAIDVEKQLDSVMSSVRELHASSSDREKLRIMSLVAPIFTRADLIRRGFVVSNDAFANARKHATQNGPGSPVAAGGRPRIYTPQLAAVVADFCNHPDNSTPINTTSMAIGNGVIGNGILFDPNSQDIQLLTPDAATMMVDYASHFLQPNTAHSGQELANMHGILPNQDGTMITKVLRHPISTLYHRFLEAHPHIHITYQALRAMIPHYIGKKTRDTDDDDIVSSTPKKKRGRPPKISNELHGLLRSCDMPSVNHQNHMLSPYSILHHGIIPENQSMHHIVMNDPLVDGDKHGIKRSKMASHSDPIASHQQ